MLPERLVVMANRIGQQLGHYRLTRKLGSGGFADVYQAEHVYLNTLAAVKLLNANLASSDIQNFHTEAKTVARLVHPHIVRVLDFGMEASMPYLVMEYAPNGTMRQRHPRGTQVPLSLVVMYTKQIASALQHAHMQRLIHRDVKPENLLLGRNNELLLGDFGAALLTHTSVMLSIQNIIGTISYMAPEQLEGKPTPASDQYALAIVVYEWLCGYCPFQGSLAEVHNLQLYEPPPSLLAKIPTLAPAVERVVMKALAKQPEQRFVTIQAFAEALEQASLHVQASPPPLFLRGDVGVQGHGHGNETLLATETFLSPSPPPLAVAPPHLAAQPFPVTMIANASIPAQPHLSRRVFLGSLIGLATIGGAGGLAWWLTQQEKQPGHATTPDPTRAPTATPIPSKSEASYIYTGHQDQVFTAAWSPNDRYIASAGGNSSSRRGDTAVHVWEAQTGHDVNSYTGHSSLVRMVAWSPDGSRIASASEDKTVQVWDATTGNNPLTYSGHTNQVRAVTWSPDGKFIASASMDHTVQIWDAITGQSIVTYNGHVTGVVFVAWSLDGKLIASASVDGKVNVWDPTSGTAPRVFPHYTVVGSLAWSPDSTSIVTGDYNDDDSVRIWTIRTEKNTKVFPRTPGNPVYTVAWSLDGKLIAAGYDQHQVKIWRAATGEQILTYTGHHASVIDVQWSHDSRYIASGGFDKTVQLWTIS
ncbi:MAG TPA: hypothetical protein DCL75_03820 [Ktedonobacter sp.]|nr:hypothetical protein [Ktedonobacter sp.]